MEMAHFPGVNFAIQEKHNQLVSRCSMDQSLSDLLHVYCSDLLAHKVESEAATQQF